MDQTGQDLLKLLFNEGESVCISDNKYATHSVPLEEALKDKVVLVSPNQSIPSREVLTKDLTLVCINPAAGFRKDDAITTFRSFLIEFDIGTIDVQRATVDYMKIPYSCQVFSGSKSLHTAIVLNEDLKDRKMYDYIADWIFSIITLADRQCGNPSRGLRIAGAIRPETGKVQELISLKNRISHKELFDWLNKYEHLRPKPKEKKVVPIGTADFSRLGPWAQAMLTKGVNFKNGRSNGWYGLAYDLGLAGFTEEDAIEILSKRFVEERDFKEKEFLRTIQSAFEKINGK